LATYLFLQFEITKTLGIGELIVDTMGGEVAISRFFSYIISNRPYFTSTFKSSKFAKSLGLTSLYILRT
jgi:hypothetical protein